MIWQVSSDIAIMHSQSLEFTTNLISRGLEEQLIVTNRRQAGHSGGVGPHTPVRPCCLPGGSSAHWWLKYEASVRPAGTKKQPAVAAWTWGQGPWKVHTWNPAEAWLQKHPQGCKPDLARNIHQPQTAHATCFVQVLCCLATPPSPSEPSRCLCLAQDRCSSR